MTMIPHFTILSYYTLQYTYMGTSKKTTSCGRQNLLVILEIFIVIFCFWAAVSIKRDTERETVGKHGGGRGWQAIQTCDFLCAG